METRNQSDAPIFAAVLTPYRSLSPRGLAILLTATGALWFVTGLLFYRLGAWPVLGFFGLDFLLLYLAFHLSYRSARSSEEVVLTRDLLLIRRTSPRGRTSEVLFNPCWVRLEVHREEDEGVTQVLVRMRDRREPVGAFLNPEDRGSFATAFGAALAEARAA